MGEEKRFDQDEARALLLKRRDEMLNDTEHARIRLWAINKVLASELLGILPREERLIWHFQRILEEDAAGLDSFMEKWLRGLPKAPQPTPEPAP